MKKIIIIPTYNELNNVQLIHRKIRTHNKNIKIIFIDDNSPDGTLGKIKSLKKNDKNILYLTRKKKYGIGSAHKFGIKWAFKNHYDVCVTMDSDMTHDPRLIPKMIKLSKNYPLVQTNRFLRKNSMSTWPIYRKILTRIRFLLLYFLLDIKYDSSGAFRCYNFKLLNPKLIYLAKNNSYSFFWETIYILKNNNIRIKELSMIQKYRVVGSSKIRLQDWLHGLFYLLVVFVKKNNSQNKKNENHSL